MQLGASFNTGKTNNYRAIAYDARLDRVLGQSLGNMIAGSLKAPPKPKNSNQNQLEKIRHAANKAEFAMASLESVAEGELETLRKSAERRTQEAADNKTAENDFVEVSVPLGIVTAGASGKLKVPKSLVNANTNNSTANQSKPVDSKDSAELSKHVYGGNGPLPSGVIEVSHSELKKLNLDGIEFENTDSGFKSKLYYDSKTSTYIYAMAGTEDGPDWNTNFAQGVGKYSVQYDLAIVNTGIIKREVNGQLHVTGHSLGGGLASSAAIVNEVSATTFNSAGVHLNTLGRYLGGDKEALQYYAKSNIDAYFVVGDMLNRLQSGTFFLAPALPNALGRHIRLQPPAGLGLLGLLPGYGGYKMHTMDTVLKSLK